MKINVNRVSITLTKEQLKEIDNQVNNKYTLDDLTSYLKACEILGEEIVEKTTKEVKILTIVRAANFLDNDNQPWKADFAEKNTSKYLPYFEKTSAGWRVCYAFGWGFDSFCPVGFYFKKSRTCDLIAKRFIDLYSQWLG